MTSHAFRQVAAPTGLVDGPLRGHHREWHVVRPGGELSDLGRVKIGEPRENILWFDRRSFASEDELLMRIEEFGVVRIPPVRRLAPRGPVIHGFVEGDALDALAPAGTPVRKHVLTQIMEVFGGLARVRPETVKRWGLDVLTDEERVREDGARAREDGEHSREREEHAHGVHFMQDLLRFTRVHVYEARQPQFGVLFDRLGVPAGALAPGSRLMSAAAQLTARPFCLLHGDLHRANFIVDPADRLWTIDWELAAVGDPLYDLATHLHLMRYPAGQEREVVQRWRTTMAEVLPGAEAGLDADLPRYLGFKRAQSVFTDVVRHAIKIRRCATTGERDGQLQHSAKAVEDALAGAADWLELHSVPGAGAIERAYIDFCRPD